MKTLKAGWLFAGGALFGLSVALCVGAGAKTNTPPKSPVVSTADSPKYEWAHIKLVGYPNGATGFFDEETGIMYVYDSQMRHCYMMRQLKLLGDPTVPVN